MNTSKLRTLEDGQAAPVTGDASTGGRVWGRGLPATFVSLRHRNYRLLWVGTLISSSGDWMDQVAFNWLVYDLTGSPVFLGLVNLCRMAPILAFTLVGGVVADRVERRKLLFTTQVIAMVLALGLAWLVVSGLVQVWMVMLVAAARGLTMSFNQPARQSLVSELVPARDLQNAIALNSAALNLTRILGPSVGGLLIAWVGVSGAFLVNGLSFLAVLYGLAQMRFPSRPGERTRASLWCELRDGVRYSASHRGLRLLIPLALLPLVFGMPYMSMLTVFAKDVLHAGSSGLGVMTAAAGAGAVLGALVVAGRAPGRPTQRMLLALWGFGLSLVAFALAPAMWLAVPALLAVGASQQVFMATNNTLIQTIVDPRYRGRVLSTLFLNRGMVPLGTIVAGALAATIAPQVAIAALAACLVTMAALFARAGRAALREVDRAFEQAVATSRRPA